MKWFDNWFRKKCIEAWNTVDEDNSATPDRDVKPRRGIAINSRHSNYVDSGSNLDSQGMRFHLYKAVGGHVLETHVYNQREDQTDHTLYMIDDKEDFAKQVAQAILMEAMKQ